MWGFLRGRRRLADGDPIDNIDPTGLITLSQIGTRFVGAVDRMTFGATGTVRDRLGLNGGLDKCSFDYRSAQRVMGVAMGGVEFLSSFTGVGMVRLAAPRVITGYTRHGLEQAIGREGAGVSPRAILHTVKNAPPTSQVGGTWKYVGDDATVVLNHRGQVVTTWARGQRGMRNQP